MADIQNDGSLLTKYRPSRYEEVLGQEAVVKSFRSVIKSGVARSFLLVGPSGVGKTTLARLGAAALGARPVDIIEADAATNTGIDAMRAITETLRFVPFGEARVRVIIIDECHALSKQAWQSILKSTEEPPPWVTWFFCTTEGTRVPQTVRTRCASYQLHELGEDALIGLLAEVADQERLALSDDVLTLCVRQAGGSARQALANLVVCSKASGKAEAAELLRVATVSSEAVQLARALVEGKGWPVVRKVLEGLAEEDAESIRRVVVAYVSRVILGQNSERGISRGLAILDAFSIPVLPSDGISSIVLAVGRCLFG